MESCSQNPMYSLEKAEPETFSDGKLNTLVKDKYGRSKEVMKIFVQAGAPEEILYESKAAYRNRYFKESSNQYAAKRGSYVMVVKRILEAK